MATRTAAETVASIQAESDEAERLQRRRQDALTHALNWVANRGEILTASTSDVLSLARRYCDFIEVGAGNPFETDPEADVRLEKAKELIGGWLSYMRAGVADPTTSVDLVGDSTIWLSEVES